MIKINLIPPEFAAAQSQKEQKILAVAGVGILAVCMMLFLGYEMLRSKRLDARIAEADNTLRQYQAIVDQIQDIEGKKQKLIAKRDVIINLNRARLTYPVFFEDLLPLVPSDVWVTDVKLENLSNIRLQSKAASNYALATWLSNLQNSTHFSNVKLDRINYEASPEGTGGQSTLSFQLTMSYAHQGAMPLTGTN